ncbi:MAG: type II secretion system F family protein [Verrucomicrobia bacterium]|nr:type II secretion system F family protein [Verrucomicrobiota bacterium]
MASYTLNFYTAEGNYKKRVIDADSPQAAESILRAEGLHPTSVKETARLDRRRYKIKLTPRELIDIYQHLELHFSSGILAVEALGALKDASASKHTRTVLHEIHQSVYHAKLGLSAAFAQFPRSFPPSTVAMIQAGEGGGSTALAKIFADIRDQIEFSERNRNAFRRGISYPALVITMSLALVIFMMTFFVPKVSRFLRELDAKMPTLTLYVVQTGDFFSRHWLLIIGSAIAIPLLVRLSRFTEAGTQLTDRLFLRLPFFNSIYRDLATATVTKYYASLKRAGKQPGETLELCERLFQNRAMAADIGEIRHNVVTRSLPLSKAFSLSSFFPKEAVVLIASGEKTANLEFCMERLSSFHSARARDRIERAIFWLNPIIIIGLGAVVGTIIVAMFLPIITAITSINL